MKNKKNNNNNLVSEIFGRNEKIRYTQVHFVLKNRYKDADTVTDKDK